MITNEEEVLSHVGGVWEKINTVLERGIVQADVFDGRTMDVHVVVVVLGRPRDGDREPHVSFARVSEGTDSETAIATLEIAKARLLSAVTGG